MPLFLRLPHDFASFLLVLRVWLGFFGSSFTFVLGSLSMRLFALFSFHFISSHGFICFSPSLQAFLCYCFRGIAFGSPYWGYLFTFYSSFIARFFIVSLLCFFFFFLSWSVFLDLSSVVCRTLNSFFSFTCCHHASSFLLWTSVFVYTELPFLFLCRLILQKRA